MAKTVGDSGRGRSHAVHRALKRAILDQALSPGAKLPEDSIGERLGVSRTLVREALVRLSEEGLVDLRPNKGATVARPTLEEGRNLFLTRAALERLVVETLAGRLTQEYDIDIHNVVLYWHFMLVTVVVTFLVVGLFPLAV